MRLPKRIKTALRSNNDELAVWAMLLDFFKTHQAQLSKRQKIKIYQKCEAYRAHWNTGEEFVSVVWRPSGEKMEIRNFRPSLGIEKEDVHPDNIYTDKDIRQHLKTRHCSLLSSITNFLTNFLLTQKSAG